jgi:hypothetical protein
VYVGFVVNSVALEHGFASFSSHICSILMFSLPLFMRWVPGLCPRRKQPGRGTDPHSLLMLRLCIGRAMPLPPLRDLVAWYSVTFPLSIDFTYLVVSLDKCQYYACC